MKIFNNTRPAAPQQPVPAVVMTECGGVMIELICRKIFLWQTNKLYKHSSPHQSPVTTGYRPTQSIRKYKYNLNKHSTITQLSHQPTIPQPLHTTTTSIAVRNIAVCSLLMCARWSQNLQSIFVSALILAPARTFVTIFNLSSAERRCCCWSTWSTHETKMKFTKRSGCVGAGAGAGSCWVLNCALINLRFMSAVLSSCWPGLEMNQRGLALFTSPDLSTLGICTHHHHHH